MQFFLYNSFDIKKKMIHEKCILFTAGQMDPSIDLMSFKEVKNRRLQKSLLKIFT